MLRSATQLAADFPVSSTALYRQSAWKFEQLQNDGFVDGMLEAKQIIAQLGGYVAGKAEQYAAPTLAVVGTTGSTTRVYYLVPKYPISLYGEPPRSNQGQPVLTGSAANAGGDYLNALPGRPPQGRPLSVGSAGINPSLVASANPATDRIYRYGAMSVGASSSTTNATLSTTNYVNITAPAASTYFPGVVFDVVVLETDSSPYYGLALYYTGLTVAAGATVADYGYDRRPYYAGAAWVTPASMTSIRAGSLLQIDTGATLENVSVLAVSATSFLIQGYLFNHAAGYAVVCSPVATTLNAAVVAGATTCVVPSIANIQPGVGLRFTGGTAETLIVSAVAGSAAAGYTLTFTTAFVNAHALGSPVVTDPAVSTTVAIPLGAAVMLGSTTPRYPFPEVGVDANTPALFTITPASMTGIRQGSLLTVDSGGSQETVSVLGTAGGQSFTAYFTKSHATGFSIVCAPVATTLSAAVAVGATTCVVASLANIQVGVGLDFTGGTAETLYVTAVNPLTNTLTLTGGAGANGGFAYTHAQSSNVVTDPSVSTTGTPAITAVITNLFLPTSTYEN